jgi:membrane fusion protein (multidrug efflux system)
LFKHSQERESCAFCFSFHPSVYAVQRVTSLFLASGLLFAAGCKKSSVVGAPPPLEVGVATAEQRDVPLYGEWVGNLDGFVNAQIQPQVSGYLIRQYYHEGQQVHKGQVLFEIDERPFQAALDQAQGQLAQARAQLELSRINVRRDQPLVAAHALAQSQLDNDTQQAAQYAAVVQTDEASVRSAQLNLGWTKVRSLVDGVAGKAVMQVGNLVSTTTPLTTVSQVNPIKAYFAISEQEYLNLSDSAKRQGVTDLLRVGSKIPLELSLSNGQVYPQKGTIVFVDRGVDNTTGTIMVAGSFPNSSSLLRPGQYAKVRALTSVQKAAILVPQRAVMDQQGQHLVVVVGANNMAATRPVTVGSQVGSDWIITSGIRAGDRVVTEGSDKIRGPMPVRPTAEQATSQGGR